MMIDDRTPRHLLPPGSGNFGSTLQTKGVMGCFVVERREVPAMIYASDRGDFTAAQIRVGVGLWMQRAFPIGGPRQRCATCDHTFESPVEPEAFFLSIPFRGDGDSIVSAVCRACVRKIGSDGLLAAALDHFTKIWPAAKVTGTAIRR